MDNFTIVLKGKGDGQFSHITAPGYANIASFLLWLTSVTDAGICGVSKNVSQPFTPTDPAAGANTDRKLEIHGKFVATGEKIRFVVPAYQDDAVETVLTNRGEVVTQESGDTILQAYKIAAGYGAAECVFTSGRVKQTL